MKILLLSGLDRIAGHGRAAPIFPIETKQAGGPFRRQGSSVAVRRRNETAPAAKAVAAPGIRALRRAIGDAIGGAFANGRPSKFPLRRGPHEGAGP